jgi:hypothetical protein
VINIGDSGVGVCNILPPNTTISGNLIVGGTLTTSGGSTLTITDLNVSNNITAGVNIACGSTLQSTDLAVTGVGYFKGSLSAVNAGFPQMQTHNITSYSAFSNVINIGDLTLGATNILTDTLNISGSIVNTVYNALQNTVSGFVTKCQHQTGNAIQTIFSDYTVCNHLQCNDLAIADWTGRYYIVIVLQFGYWQFSGRNIENKFKCSFSFIIYMYSTKFRYIWKFEYYWNNH